MISESFVLIAVFFKITIKHTVIPRLAMLSLYSSHAPVIGV